jgi:hypothetical protein
MDTKLGSTAIIALLLGVFFGTIVDPTVGNATALGTELKENAVWIVNGVWPQFPTNKHNVLVNHLDEVMTDLENSGITMAFVFVGYWDPATATISYTMTDAQITTALNAFHAKQIKVLAWAENNGQIDIVNKRQVIYDEITECMNKGFDGYHDDIESYTPNCNQQDYINYLNNATALLHNMSKLMTAAVFCDWKQNTNPYLHMDYIVTMFYGNQSFCEDPQGRSYWQESFGQYEGNNNPPASPVIMGLMNRYTNKNKLTWQLNWLTNELALDPHPQLSGFCTWVYEYMSPVDWQVWKYWTTRINSSTPPVIHNLKVDSSPVNSSITFDGRVNLLPWSEDCFEEVPYTLSIDAKISTALPTVTNYRFANWSDGSTSSARTVTLTADLALTANYILDTPTPTDIPQSPSKVYTSLSLSASSKTIYANSPVTFSGILSDSQGKCIGNTPVSIYNAHSGSSQWNLIAKTLTNSLGKYDFTWNPSAVGSLTIKAEWTGNQNQYGTNKVTRIEVLSNPTALSIRLSRSTSDVGLRIAIVGRLSSNGIGLPSLPVLLSYSLTNGQTWNEISQPITTFDGDYSFLWMPTVTGEYIMKAVWAGNVTTQETTAFADLAVIDYTPQNIFFVTSNSTISSLSYESASRELRFIVSGPDSTVGYVEVAIAKSLLADIQNAKVKLNNTETAYMTSTLNDSWLLCFNYVQSTHTVVVSLEGHRSLPSGIPIETLTLIGITIIAHCSGIGYYILRKRKTRTAHTKSTKKTELSHLAMDKTEKVCLLGRALMSACA